MSTKLRRNLSLARLAIVLVVIFIPGGRAYLRQKMYQEDDSSFERVHYIRRLYGKENADVRSHIDYLENRMLRYQTGLNTDPNHKLPYVNHPFEKQHELRSLQASNETAQSDDIFKPIRITFDTSALDALSNSANAAKIKWYEEVILPKTKLFWEQALSVVPVDGNLKISAGELDQRAYCGASDLTEVPSSHIANGVSNTDLILYVSGNNSPTYCPSRTLAVAVPCNFDQYDRPTAGAINVCLDNIELDETGESSLGVEQDYVDVTIHEVGHVLGHSSNSYRFFWDPKTGAPRTPRPFETRKVTCVNGEQREGFFPAENTMVFGQRADGRRFASIVTEKVAQIAKNQFNCQTLEGAQLENQPTRPDSCNGDHWDERLFYPEALSGVISPTANIVSSLTLALFEDSGWYKANYTMSQMSPWGLGAGCEFATGACLTQGTNGPSVPEYSQGFFCASQGEKSCSPELTHKMACSISDYNLFVPQVLPPSRDQYFPEPSLGGPRQADYCPVYGSTYSNRKAEELDCRNPSNGNTFISLYGEEYSGTSKCIPSSSGEGRCYRTACVRDQRHLEIFVAGKWRICEYDGMPIELTVVETGSFGQTLFCPKLSQACPDLFCPFNCAGRGVCNYDHMVDGITRPKCECFDESDTSEACSDSDIPDGGFLDNSDGLIDNIEENFFDPLIAVFFDHPDKWTTASWAWAGGLGLIGVVMLLCICSSCFCQGGKKKTRYRNYNV